MRVLLDEERLAGSYEIQWDGLSDEGAAIPSGVYFYRVSAGDFKVTKQMVLLR